MPTGNNLLKDRRAVSPTGLTAREPPTDALPTVANRPDERGGVLVPKVYMVSARAATIRDNFVAKIDRLFSVPDFAAVISGGKTVFVKTNYCQAGYTRYLRPILLRMLVEKIQELGGSPAVTDSSDYFPQGHFTGDQWFAAAELMGYSELALGCARLLANGYEGGDGEFISTAGVELGGVEVARVVREADSLVVVTHVTGHPLAGLYGALVNLGLDCLNNAGKARLYENLRPQWLKEHCEHCHTCIFHCQWQALESTEDFVRVHYEKCSGCGACVMVCPRKAMRFSREQAHTFQRRVAESSAAIVKTLGKQALYLNFLLDVVPQPDRFSWADTPFIPDVGILASTDPVAVDAATWEMITRFPGSPQSAAEDCGVLMPGIEKLEAITGVHPEAMLAQAEELEVGSRRFHLLI